MVSVILDGEEHFAGASSARSMGELVELVKASIDPDTMITSIQLAGSNLSEQDWTRPLSTMGAQVIEVKTGTKEEFVRERMLAAVQVIDHIATTFERAAGHFEVSSSFDGSEQFKQGVDEFHAFLSWFATLFSLGSITLSGHEPAFTAHVDTLTQTSEQLLQQQMYQSWWAMSETIRKSLVPELLEIKNLIAKVQSAY